MPYFHNNTNINIIKSDNSITFNHIFDISSPESHKLHINDYYEIYVYIRGDADYIVDNSFYNLSKGDIIIINPYCAHKVVLKEEGPYERFYILIHTDAFDGYAINPLNIINKGICFIDLGQSKQHGLDILYKISQLSGFRDSSSEITKYGLLLEFLGLITNALIQNKQSDTIPQKANIPIILAKIMEYIEKNFREIQSVSQISDYFNFSLPYISTMFKKNLGTNIKNYIQAKKVAYAKELLDIGYNVTEACYESGFNDCSYFIKIFKKYTGNTPLQYKKDGGTHEQVH